MDFVPFVDEPNLDGAGPSEQGALALFVCGFLLTHCLINNININVRALYYNLNAT